MRGGLSCWLSKHYFLFMKEGGRGTDVAAMTVTCYTKTIPFLLSFFVT
jgi:hypothetical protein